MRAGREQPRPRPAVRAFSRYGQAQEGLPDARSWITPGPGHGPMRVLPGLAPARFTAAFAVTDDDRVGGAAQDARGQVRPVVWTCAAKQAFVLPSTRS